MSARARTFAWSAGPYLLFALAAAYLAARWQDIPLRFPIHWNARGEVNGWATRSVFGVFGPLLLGVLICLSLELVEVAVRSVKAQAPNPETARAQSEQLLLTRRIVRATRCFLALLFGGISLLPFVARPEPLLWLILPATALFLGGVLYAAVRATRSAAAVTGPDPHWKWGVFYVNPDDKAVLVPKRLGIGFTLNFASPVSWLLLLLLLAPGVLAVAFALASGN